MLILAVFNEAFIHEPTIVSMIMVNVNSHVLSKMLVAVLGLNGLSAGDGLLQINVGVSCILIHEHSRVPVPLGGELALELGNEASH